MPDDLDVRIRELVALAVADTPHAPELDPTAMSVSEQAPERRGWWIGGGVALLAVAAALAATFVLVGPGDDSVTTPASLPSSQPAPVTSAAPTTTFTEVATATDGVLTAGPDGVVLHVAGETRTLTSEPMAIALDAGDGRVIVQRTKGDVPLVLDAGGSLSNLFDTADWDGAVTLHDIEVVDGRRLLLFTLRTGEQATLIETLYVVDLDTMERNVVTPLGGDESGTHRLHLAATGLIVGEGFAEANHYIVIETVPGSPAAGAPRPTATGLGLEENYPDCTECPHAFTVTPDGRAIMWINSAGGMLEAVWLDQPIWDAEPVVEVPDGRVIDVDADEADALLSFFGDPTQAPVLVPFGGGEQIPLEGVAATRASLGEAAVSPPASTTTTTTTTTAAPEAPAGVLLVTAGDDGITVIENGIEVRRLDQPAEIALLTPGGAVVFQPRRRTSDGTPGDPLIWHPDGTIERLLGPLEAGAWYRLHDVAEIDGIPTILYGERTQGPAPEDNTESVKALSLAPGSWTTTDVTSYITWEGGFSRLSLSNGGTVVGTTHETVVQGFFATVVPGSPDALEGHVWSPSELGLEESYAECSDCPNHFTISHDGESIVWTDGAAITVYDTVGGETRSWDVPALAEQLVGSLDVRTSSDGGVEAAISFVSGDGETVTPPVVIATSPPGNVVATPVAGRVVAFGP